MKHQLSVKSNSYILDNINIVRSKKLINKDNLFLLIYVQEIVQLLGRVLTHITYCYCAAPKGSNYIGTYVQVYYICAAVNHDVWVSVSILD